jgi:chromosome segregation ATPase
MPQEFSSLSDAQAAFDALEADAAASNDLLAEAQASTESLTAALSAAQAELETANAANADLAAKLTAAETAATEAEAAAEKLKAESRSAEAIAASICASLNIDPQATAPDGGQSKNAWETYQAITHPAEKTAYWRANQEAIVAAAKRA